MYVYRDALTDRRNVAMNKINEFGESDWSKEVAMNIGARYCGGIL